MRGITDHGPAFDRGAAAVLARYQGGYGDGLAAVVRHQFGAGRVIAVGCPLDRETTAGSSPPRRSVLASIHLQSRRLNRVGCGVPARQ